ncbi:hypothetical protein [Hyphobacterium sp.]|uniref:hypothetical protein n=1 Tax=Hyphobacterium sp. TaxID=2004662 RepID=UPI003BA9BD90
MSAISWEVFGPFILIAMIAIGVFVYSLFPQIGYLGAGGISLAIVLVVFIAIGKKRKPDDS